MVTCLKFFLGKDPEEKEGSSESEDEVDPKEVALANKVNKKSRKREKQLTKVKKLAAKAYKKKSAAPTFNFSALHLVHDPQGKTHKAKTASAINRQISKDFLKQINLFYSRRFEI